MKYSTKKARIFTAAYSAYMDIENMYDLKRNGITLPEYNIIFDLLKEFSSLPDSWLCCMYSGVANWFRKHGFAVKDPDGENINYRIGLLHI